MRLADELHPESLCELERSPDRATAKGEGTEREKGEKEKKGKEKGRKGEGQGNE